MFYRNRGCILHVTPSFCYRRPALRMTPHGGVVPCRPALPAASSQMANRGRSCCDRSAFSSKFCVSQSLLHEISGFLKVKALSNFEPPPHVVKKCKSTFFNSFVEGRQLLVSTYSSLRDLL